MAMKPSPVGTAGLNFRLREIAHIQSGLWSITRCTASTSVRPGMLWRAFSITLRSTSSFGRKSTKCLENRLESRFSRGWRGFSSIVLPLPRMSSNGCSVMFFPHFYPTVLEIYRGTVASYADHKGTACSEFGTCVARGAPHHSRLGGGARIARGRSQGQLQGCRRTFENIGQRIAPPRRRTRVGAGRHPADASRGWGADHCRRRESFRRCESDGGSVLRPATGAR